MTELKKLYKVFTLIRLLNTPPAKDAKRLMRILGVKKSHFYRLKNLLKDLGYKIHTNAQHRMSFETSVSEYGNGIIEPAELWHIQDILQQVKGNHPMTAALLNKLDANLSFIPLADSLPQLHANRNIQLIRSGISSNRCLTLRQYRSLASKTITDRTVAPLEMTEDCQYLIAWDLDKDGQRQFKISRIQDVEIVDKPIPQGLISSPMDIFGLTGEEWIDVKLELTPFAHHLFVEDYPLSIRYISTKKQKIIFDGRVRNYKGIGRTILSLPGEIKVLEPQGLKDYLRTKILEFDL